MIKQTPFFYEPFNNLCLGDTGTPDEKAIIGLKQ
jgi:hypothetical protein